MRKNYLIDDDEDGDELIVPNPNTKISSKTETDMDYSQWQVGPNGKYRAAARTVANLPSGVYKIEQDESGLYLQLQDVISDNIVELPETANTHVLGGMKKFWTRKDHYKKFGFVYKRGVLLWGPPGSGKSVTINLLMKELISFNGIVLLCGHPEYLAHMMQRVRQMEPDRPIIVVLEDIDEIIEKHGEHAILSMLDGENQIANVVYVATTNYPERLGARIVNRPSRFDERIKVGMPSDAARKTYLQFATAAMEVGMTEEDINKWVRDTESFSIAHLRELVAAVYCLDQDYKVTLKRLRSMCEKPKFQDGFRKSSAGFGDEDDKEEKGESTAVKNMTFLQSLESSSMVFDAAMIR
jgi:AAA+ superfamily predicted ATPase